MKKIFAFLFIVVMVLSVATACGSNSLNDNTDSAAQGNTSATDEKSENNTNSNKFTIKGITFIMPGDFKENGAKDNAIAINNGSFTVSVNYNGETSYESQEEIVKSNAKSVQKYNSDSTVEVFQNESNGIFYYTEKGGEYNLATCTYIVDGVSLSFITTDFSDEALNAISSVEFE